MADIYRNEGVTYQHEGPDYAPAGITRWGAIWAGMFTFVTIWSIFGLLGEAIFASNANPNAANPVTGMTWGEGAWAIILTIIAFYVAGRITSTLARVTTRNDAIIHGMVMFGLSVVATVLVIAVGGITLNGVGLNAGAHSPWMLTVFADVGWIGFVALILGWFAAMGGAAHGIPKHPAEQKTTGSVRDIRPAA